MASKPEFDHIKNLWLGALDPDHPVSLALRGGNYTRMRGLLKLIRKLGAIDKLKYTDPTDNTEKDLNEDQKEEIAAVLSYINWLCNEHGFTSVDNLNVEDYDQKDFLDFITRVFDSDNPIDFDHGKAVAAVRAKELHEIAMKKMSADNADAMTGSTVISSNTNTSSDGSSQNRSQSKQLSAEERTLAKATQPNPERFNVLEKEWNFSVWYPAFVAEANLQGFGNQMDAAYKPSTDQEKTVWEVRQKLFFSYLAKVLKTDKGVDIVGKHCKDTNAQAVWSELIAYHTTSAKAESMRRKFHQMIVTATVDPSAKAESEILRLKSYFRAYNSYTSNPLTEDEEHSYMSRFAAQSKDIGSVTNLTALVEVVTKTTLGPEQKMVLIESQAFIADDSNDA